MSVNVALARDRLGVGWGIRPHPSVFFLNNVRSVTGFDGKIGMPFRTSILHNQSHTKFWENFLKTFWFKLVQEHAFRIRKYQFKNLIQG